MLRSTLLALLLILTTTMADAAVPWDVAPIDLAGATAPQACPVGDGIITVADALIVLRRGLGLISSFSCFGGPVPDSIVDVAPPAFVDSSVFPATLLAGGDGNVNAADALLVLRAAVRQVQLTAPPPNLSLRAILGTVPQSPALGEIDRPPLGDFPTGSCEDGAGDCDCNLNGVLDPQEPSFMRVVVTSEHPATEPYDVCAWLRQDAFSFDFDAPPKGNFPGPEDHDGGGDGVFSNPPPAQRTCVTVCPERGAPPGVTCSEVDPVSGDLSDGFILNVGPLFPDALTSDRTQRWTAVVDPDHALPDDAFSDNVATVPLIATVDQCPDVAPDLSVEGRALTVVPASPSQFDDVQLKVTVTNQGDLRVIDAFDVDLYIDPQPVPFFVFPVPGGGPALDPDDPDSPRLPFPPGDSFRTVAASPETPLLEGEDVLVVFSDFDPTESGTQPLNLEPGLHSAMVLVDSVGEFRVGAIEEENETNNVFPDSFASKKTLICVGASAEGFGRPDLTFAGVRFLKRGSTELACDRGPGDLVDIELTIINLDEDPTARDLDISRFARPTRYDIRTAVAFPLPDPLPNPPPLPGCQTFTNQPCTALDGLEFDCVPLGLVRAPLRGRYLFPIQDTEIRLELRQTDVKVPSDVNLANNTISVPLLSRRPTVDAGPPISGVEGEPVQLNASTSDPNDVPSGSEPLELSWSVVVKPQDATTTFSDDQIEDPTFTGSDEGTYTLELSATDCPGVTAVVDTVVITLTEPAP